MRAGSWSCLLAAACCALPACAGRSSQGDTDTGAASSAEATSSAWCGSGFKPIGEDACVFLPEKFSSTPSVVVFVHGMIAPGALPTVEQTSLAEAAGEGGFAVLFPRGKAGLCTWDPQFAPNLCWPTKQEVVDKEAPAIVAAWTAAQARAEKLAGVKFGKRYLFGFSNGGYFAAFLASEGRFPIDGAGVVGAGRTAVDESLLGAARPVYVATGDQEAEVTRHDAATLAQVLTQKGWPVTVVSHPSRGHELHADDITAAFAAWSK